MTGKFDNAYILAIHIGVTKTHSAIVNINNNQLKIIEKSKIEKQGKTEAQIIEIAIGQTLKLIKESNIDEQKILGTGISTAGPVDIQQKRILFLPNLNNFSFDIEKDFKNALPAPIYIDNDANAVTLAELNFGKGRNINNFICIIISTGIGAGIVINHDIYRGSTGTAGEFGHNIINFRGIRCRCGKNGCWEAYASGWALIERMKQQISFGRSTSLISKVNELAYVDICNAADDGDPLSLNILKENGRYIGIGIANLINTFDPDKIIICGGLYRAYNYFEGTINSQLEESIIPRKPPIEVTGFENNAELFGTAATFLHQYQMNKKD